MGSILGAEFGLVHFFSLYDLIFVYGAVRVCEHGRTQHGYVLYSRHSQPFSNTHVHESRERLQ